MNTAHGQTSHAEAAAPPTILVVDDEEIVIRSTVRILEGLGATLKTAPDAAHALRELAHTAFDLAILDIMMPGIDGIELLRRIKEATPDTEVIMFTGLAQVSTAVNCMKLGAFDYIAKPFEPDELKLAVTRALEHRALRRENSTLRQAIDAKYRLDRMVGQSAAVQQVYRLIAQCAATHSTVLITGESGTGKELAARAIHHNSLRSSGPFVTVDCGSLSEALLESELFGHARGAFSGAVARKKGMVEVAEGGTLFMDEIGNLPPAIQSKLLRLIQQHEFRAVGDTRTQTANFRLVAATNKDLAAMAAEGSFAADLYYRLAVFPIHLPPLRERRDDIPGLAYHFMHSFARELGKDVDSISEAAMCALVAHDWPGNIRQLENALHRAVILCDDKVLRAAHLDGIAVAQADEGQDVPRTGEELKRQKKRLREKSVEELEHQFVLEALKRNDWNVTRSAQETSMLRANFQALMRKHNVRVRGAADDGENEGGAGEPAPQA
ncbi:fused response regulator of ato opeon, in two-component system with AtoS: response regulator; sigma54 interaction protein [Rubrivivax sp. A210]|uniref:sigma-54-dependent transcriptional regulator n=1 Tax=Rubrivivax sp. A210 TaxID=2772301 RepID=UPI00191A359F|nr:sigma-54 dependent transcriptional regulator [Rubrivivax sp. A210]CAD5372803.1 fused response regulator of ato opeon, in two-component system with AtoS: response regulator; sigma54 interaction protein [Rubrivivax sp. A210]